jgi:hypothetical protein
VLGRPPKSEQRRTAQAQQGRKHENGRDHANTRSWAKSSPAWLHPP